MACNCIYILVLALASIYLYRVYYLQESFIAPMTAKIIDQDLLQQYVNYHQQVDSAEQARRVAAHTVYRQQEPYAHQDEDLEFAAKYGLQAAIQKFDTGVGSTKNMNV